MNILKKKLNLLLGITQKSNYKLKLAADKNLAE